MASRSWNRVELIGNLTRDPELRYTPNGAAVCTFGLATNRTYVTEGEKREEVDFHRLVAWNKLAEICNQFLKKGTKVFVSGRLRTHSWEVQEGQTRQTTEIVVEDMIILSPKGSGEPLAEKAEVVKEEPKEEESSSTNRVSPKALAVAQAAEDKEEEASKKEKKATPEENLPQEEVEDLPF